jgi:5-methylcytosine-specific restriction endonuclease McrA
MNFRRMASQWRSSSKRRLAELHPEISEEGPELPSLDETEAAIKGYFSTGCAYCGCRLTASGRGKVEMDHAVPISRGGGAGTDNLRLCCHGDNSAKGALTEVEFKSLLALLDTWDPGAAQSLLVRLKGGYWCYRPTTDRRAAERRAVVETALKPVGDPNHVPWPV